MTEQPTVFEGNVASYDFTCHDPVAAVLGTAPTVNLNPDVPDASGDFVDGQAAEPDIFWVQQRLLDLGYSEVGKVDGAIGRRTRQALIAFKADNGLAQTAEIDAAVIQALLVAPPRKSPPPRPTEEPAGGTPEPQRVVGTPPAPGISCEGGFVREGQCACRRGFHPVKAGQNAFQCRIVAVDPPVVLPPVRTFTPTVACEGGVVRAGKCVCPRNTTLRGGACRSTTANRVEPQRVAPQRVTPQRVAPQRVAPLRIAPTIRRTP